MELQSASEHKVSGLQKPHEHEEKDEDTVVVDFLDFWRRINKKHFKYEVY